MNMQMQSSSKNPRQKIQQKVIFQLANNSLGEIGAILRDARERKLLSLNDIKEKTCIPAHHVLAIETGDRAKLPEDLFLLGFIKRYAKAVGLNDRVLCEKYLRTERFDKQNEENDAFDLLFQEEKKRKVIPLEPERKYININDHFVEKSFLKVYHFYFFVGILLFMTAGYLVFQTLKDSHNNTLLASSTTLEDDKYIENEENQEENERSNTESTEPEVDVGKIDSWVEENEHNMKLQQQKQISNQDKDKTESNVTQKEDSTKLLQDASLHKEVTKSNLVVAEKKNISEEKVNRNTQDIQKNKNVSIKKSTPQVAVKKNSSVAQLKKNTQRVKVKVQVKKNAHVMPKTQEQTALPSVKNISKQNPDNVDEIMLRPLRMVAQ